MLISTTIYSRAFILVW